MDVAVPYCRTRMHTLLNVFAYFALVPFHSFDRSYCAGSFCGTATFFGVDFLFVRFSPSNSSSVFFFFFFLLLLFRFTFSPALPHFSVDASFFLSGKSPSSFNRHAPKCQRCCYIIWHLVERNATQYIQMSAKVDDEKKSNRENGTINHDAFPFFLFFCSLSLYTLPFQWNDVFFSWFCYRREKSSSSGRASHTQVK